MALDGCGLDEAGRRAQAARYAQLGGLAASLDRSELGLTVTFAASPDAALLATTLAVERECCSFLALDYDPEALRLRVGVEDPSDRPVLDLIERALRSASPQA
jgi:hypothetical protein